MLAVAQNIDVMCLELMNNYSQLDNNLQKRLDHFINELSTILEEKENVKLKVDRVLPQVFNLRIAAIKWLVSEGQLNLTNLLDEIYPQIEILKENHALEILADNILFALRCNHKVAKSLMAVEDFSEDSIKSEFSKQALITYEQFVSSLYQIPGEGGQIVLDWMHASLYIEFVVIAAVLINDKKLKVATTLIDELAFLISNAAQEYTATAVLLGILEKPRRNNIEFANIKFSDEFIQDQKSFADVGLFDYASKL